MTVADLQQRMSNSEFVGWQIFHGRRGQRRELEQKMAQRRR